MTNLMQRLLELIPRVISNIGMSVEEVPLRVEARDNEHFADAWMSAYERLRGETGDIDALTEPCRKAAYFAAFSEWNSPDLASLISDDFGLFSELVLKGLENSFVQGLATAYFLEHRFPCDVCSSELTIAEIVGQS